MLHEGLRSHEIGREYLVYVIEPSLIGSLALCFSDTSVCDSVENICSRTAVLAAVEVMMRERVYLSPEGHQRENTLLYYECELYALWIILRIVVTAIRTTLR